MSSTTVLDEFKFSDGNIIAGYYKGVSVPVEANDYESGMIAIAGANNRYKAGTKAEAEGAGVRGVFYIGGDGKATKANGQKLTMLTAFSEVFGSKLKAPNGTALGPTQQTKNNLLYHAEIIVKEG